MAYQPNTPLPDTQHPTTNAQLPTTNEERVSYLDVGRWMLVVGRSTAKPMLIEEVDRLSVSE
jgi:hypothetical protein